MRTHVLATAAVIAMTPLASADLLINDGYMLDISATAGTGSSTSYLVIDFAATNGISFAFAYQWDGLATTHDMMLALSDIGLGYEWTDWGTGIFADNLTWDGQAGDSSLFWAHSLATPTGNGQVNWSDAWSSIDTTTLSDGLISGWYNGFNEDYSAITPTLPLIAVPGPASIAGLVVLGFGRRRRTA
ncbi:MAG: hypothetical protein P8M32_05430 [Phycisphaerales bacterium]|nr:hypothetical protein [Phycisphaerales bacterium]